jgi:hypothetical protein
VYLFCTSVACRDLLKLPSASGRPQVRTRGLHVTARFTLSSAKRTEFPGFSFWLVLGEAAAADRHVFEGFTLSPVTEQCFLASGVVGGDDGPGREWRGKETASVPVFAL